MKNLALVFSGMALMLALVLGWDLYQGKAAADGPMIDEIWAVYGTPAWDDFQDGMNLLYSRGYTLKGYAVSQNSKGSMVKFAVMEKR